MPLGEIIEVTEDNTYAGLEKAEVISIETAYGKTDYILIKTVQHNYPMMYY